MAEYIERESLINKVENLGIGISVGSFARGCLVGVAEIIQSAPAADVAPVVHGEWIAIEKWASKAQYKCSVCGRRIMASLDVAKVMGKYPYCNCGAKMQEAR